MYFYRFLRSRSNGKLNSELTEPIVFYCSDEVENKSDFTSNTPVIQMESAGIPVQVVFGMSTIEDCIYIYELFDYPKAILARVSMEYLTSTWNVQLHNDQQLPSGPSKYLMAPCLDGKIIIPDCKVEILSIEGWRTKADMRLYQNQVFNLKPAEYIDLIKSSIGMCR